MQSHLSHILPHTTFSTRNKPCARTWTKHVSRTKTCATPSPREDKWRQTFNRLHTSGPVIKSRAGPGGADRADDHLVFTSEPSAQREPPSPPPCLRGGLTFLEPLAACGRVVLSNLDTPRTFVSLSRAALLRVQTAPCASAMYTRKTTPRNEKK